jgi:hypothetical protein
VRQADSAARVMALAGLAPGVALAQAVAKPTAIARAAKRTAIAPRGQVARRVVRAAAVLQAVRERAMARPVAVHRTMRVGSAPEAGRARRDRGMAETRDPIQVAPVAAHARRRATGRADADRRENLDARGVG